MTEPRADRDFEGGGNAAFEVRHASKRFGHVVALDDVSLSVERGEILAIMGDNGAGKSTLIKIMAGLQRPDSGEVVIDGRETHFRSPVDALAAGVAAVFQDLALVEVLDVSTNMFLGQLPKRGPFVDRRRMARETSAAFADLDVKIPSVRAEIGMLSGGQRQIVAIARVLQRGSSVVLLDEPTAALGVRETNQVAGLISELRAKSRAVIVVSHDLNFVFEIADRIQVMRLGRVAGTRRIAATDRDEVVSLITGSRGPIQEGGSPLARAGAPS